MSEQDYYALTQTARLTKYIFTSYSVATFPIQTSTDWIQTFFWSKLMQFSGVLISPKRWLQLCYTIGHFPLSFFMTP